MMKIGKTIKLLQTFITLATTLPSLIPPFSYYHLRGRNLPKNRFSHRLPSLFKSRKFILLILKVKPALKVLIYHTKLDKNKRKLRVKKRKYKERERKGGEGDIRKKKGNEKNERKDPLTYKKKKKKMKRLK